MTWICKLGWFHYKWFLLLRTRLWDFILVGEKNETFLIRVRKSLCSKCVLKIVTLMVIRNELKWTIFASCGLWLCTSGVLARTLGPQREWIVRSHIDWKEDGTFFIRVWKLLSSKLVSKILTPMVILNRLKWTIFVSCGLWLIQNGIGVRHWALCQWGRWVLNGSELWDPRTRTKHFL